MQKTRKTLLSVGVAVVLAIGAAGCDHVTHEEFDDYRQNTLNPQLDDMANWIDSARTAMAWYNARIVQLGAEHGNDWGGIDPPPDPCPNEPEDCDW